MIGRSNYKCSLFCSFFKGEKFIQGYLENALEQSIFKDIEFVFLNCASPENEEKFLLPIAEKYDNVKYIKLDKDPGLYASWNIAIDLCSSDIIGNWNIDDRKSPDSIEVLVNSLLEDSSIDMVYGPVFISTVANETYEDNPKNQVYKIQHPSFGLYLTHNSPHCMPMWRKRVHEKCGYFSEKYNCVSDAEMWLRLLLKNGNIKAINHPIGLYYFNPDGLSSSQAKARANYIEASEMKQDIICQIGKGNNIGIDKIMPIHHELQNNYIEKIIEGVNYLKDKKIVFAGLCRSLEDRISENIKHIESHIKNSVSEYKILIFENDSSDGTKEILRKLNSENKNVIPICNDYNIQSFGQVKSTNRMMAFAKYRTELQNYIRDHFSHYDYVILFDTDFLDLSIDGIFNSFGWIKSKDIDAMAGYSYSFKNSNGLYHIWNYDSWAYRETLWQDLESSPLYPDLQPYPSMAWFGYKVFPRGSDIIKVKSAFGGSAIYKTNVYLDGKYGHDDCDHVTFHKSILDKRKEFKLFANPSQVSLLKDGE